MDNLEMFRRFYYEYPALISEAMSRKLDVSVISDAPRRKSPSEKSSPGLSIGYTLRDQSWQPGKLHPNLSWTHYRTLLRIDWSDARAFHEIEAIQNNWSARDPSFRPRMPSGAGLVTWEGVE
ncbi:MAG: hypothetical protein V1878_08765 [bacterium]